jgi:hypothetical protein
MDADDGNMSGGEEGQHAPAEVGLPAEAQVAAVSGPHAGA